ncbi:hypothetical protein Pst134EB_025093 [Puccinia striiformis f. sp. tritici]|nr:hypothetical protein Pst134EB_025093 [Puccinia striiformis f. sp. tritici]
MQLPNILPILMVLVLSSQGNDEGSSPNFVNHFGCGTQVENHGEAGCVSTMTQSANVVLMIAPWDPIANAYNCGMAEPRFLRASCCTDLYYVQNELTVPVWKAQCREIDGSEIKQY